MLSVIFVFVMIILCMWVFGRLMYPRPPKGYILPKEGESTELRECHFCKHKLEEYRGIMEGELFFCNDEHQAQFHAGKIYQPYQEKL